MNDLKKLKQTRRKARRLSRKIMWKYYDLPTDAWVNSPADKAGILRGFCEGFDAEWNHHVDNPGSHGSNICRILFCHWRAALRELKKIAAIEYQAAPGVPQTVPVQLDGAGNPLVF